MASHHTRSLSFPSKPHPIADQLDEHLCRLRSSQAASTASLTNKLTGLNELYQCVDEFLQLPLHQNTLSQMLDGSLRLLDIFAISRDVLVQSKERLQTIQSLLRRRCSSGELNMTNEIVQYQNTRKTIKKIIKRCLKDIKEVEKTNEANSDTEGLLKDVQAVTIDGFKSLLSYIGGSQKSNWSLSKLVRQRAEKETAAGISEFDAFDATIESVMCQKKKANVDVSQVMKLESQIQEIDEVLECLFRRLIKTRAILLNVLSN